jgi:cyclopropane fatty-acyl-phospholipid synthase-like methyltransferase
MTPNLDLACQLLQDPRYPRTCKYDPEWQVGLDMGCPTFWLLESLCDVMDLKTGMRVLDLGCGKAGGSIFLAREFGLQVWAVDRMVRPTENWERIIGYPEKIAEDDAGRTITFVRLVSRKKSVEKE